MFKILMVCVLGALTVAPALASDAPPLEATLICRPAAAGDRANAMMTAQSEHLVCKPLAMSMKTSDGSLHVIGTAVAKAKNGPDLSHALTGQQVNDAWVRYVETAFQIDHSP